MENVGNDPHNSWIKDKRDECASYGSAHVSVLGYVVAFLFRHYIAMGKKAESVNRCWNSHWNSHHADFDVGVLNDITEDHPHYRSRGSDATVTDIIAVFHGYDYGTEDQAPKIDENESEMSDDPLKGWGEQGK